MTRTFVGLSYSGWTEKARWALDHHRVSYRYREHIPLLGEPWLRRHTQPGVRPSVPLLLDEAGPLTGSFAIARRAEEMGRGEPLFPADASETIARWEDVSERVLGVARAYVVARLPRNRRAQAESLPSFLPAWARGLFAPSATMAARFLARKHHAPADVDAAISATVIPAFEQLRAALGGRAYLRDRFTYADITAAVMLQFVRPVDDAYLPLGPGTRELWSHADLATRFPELLAWRDDLYAKHRRP
ncbi:glutathione S-transferase C-terminal domain-containing protein [Archangium violaceum]|uniref:glutathione S-transferase C-terminal domain-containing protein n=1 Tax=Archangium violaceum TaxID=83451 RepID=UPI00194F961C|nr:glutathione S-transferase C-terminal domain-containing protein [Archangium violaceum]QRN98183.1 glutathione S-transferase C-terminal domain-containing protein [Archangium violaceum]